MKCSGERSQALRWATAPGGSSRRDLRGWSSSLSERSTIVEVADIALSLMCVMMLFLRRDLSLMCVSGECFCLLFLIQWICRMALD